METVAVVESVPRETSIPMPIYLLSLASDWDQNSYIGLPEQFITRHPELKIPQIPDSSKAWDDASKLPIFTCTVDLHPGVKVRAWAIGNYVFIGGMAGPQGMQIHTGGRKVEEVEPFIKVEPVGKAFHKTVERDIRDSYYSRMSKKQVIDTYGDTYDYGHQRKIEGIPWNYLKVNVSINAAALVTNAPQGWVQHEGLVKCPRPEGGTVDLDTYGPDARVFRASQDFFGLALTWDESLDSGNSSDGSCDYRWMRTHRLLGDSFTIKQGKDTLWKRFLDSYEDRSKLSKGVKSTLTKKGIKENVEKLKTEEPLLWSYVAWLHNEKVRDGISNNTLLAAFLEARGQDYNTLKQAVQESMAFALTTTASPRYRKEEPENRDICLGLPGAKDKDEEKRAKKEWYLRKTNKSQAEGIGVSPEAHPKLLACIESGAIPLGLFHKAGDQLHLINVEFDLWERALEREGWAGPLCEIAEDASRRTTYEKVVTMYIAFLFRIEKYLDRHTGKGKKWRAFPKFVKSEWELEMNEAAEGGTTKRRSAMTPIPDNHARTITVPYVAMAIHGVRTTYCYSLDYQVFEEMTVDRESSTPIVNELERKLNGRDDYGLMYYTLTGTDRNTGYPTFLIIFERRKENTHVHFHRVHPNRSKEGKPTPATRLVEECYRYMAGNVRAEEIYAQQGDLIFIKTEQAVELTPEAKHVKEFESHAFKPMEGKPILLIPNEAKSIKNRLGFIYSEGIWMVDHPEHEPLKGIPAGMYEVRRCKSFEASPKGVWVLNID
jgi:hypothetical protein